MTTVNEDGDLEEEKWADFSGILNKLKNYLFEYYEPVKDPKDAEMHFSTNELCQQLYKLIPCDGLSPDLVANWMHLGGFTFADYGEMRFEWMMKRKTEEMKMDDELKIGDKVEVLDEGLLMLQKFAPEGAKPNNHGVISEIWEDGTLLIEFPIGDDDPKEHSQVAPYPREVVRKLK